MDSIKETISNETEAELRKKIDIKPRVQQRVRTTFSLSQEGHKAIKKLSVLLHIKQADVFGRLILDYDGVKDLFKKAGIDLFSNLAKVKNRKTIRKTYVLEGKVLSKLRTISKMEKISRDLFVDQMSRLFEVLLDKERAEKQKKYSNILENDIYPLWESSQEIEKKLRKELGEDDPVVIEYGIVAGSIMECVLSLEEILTK